MVTTTFCTSGQVLIKAGKGVDSSISGGTLIKNGDHAVDIWIAAAEQTINGMCRYNFLTNYSSLVSGGKLILQDVASDLAAINAICYDMSGYTSRVEAEDMINVRRDSALRGLAILRDKKNQAFVVDPTKGTV